MIDGIWLVNLTSFSWALINTSALFMVNMSNFVQKCLALIIDMLVNMSEWCCEKPFVNTVLCRSISIIKIQKYVSTAVLSWY